MTFAVWAGAACAALTAVNLASIGLAWSRLRPSRMPAAALGATPPVTIIRPVCGIESYIEETLGTSFALAYPEYEVLFCVEREDDPVVPLVRRLIAAHPGVPARLLVGEDRISANPKLNNCVKGWREARHDWVVLADSNVLMPPDYLQRLLEAWRPETGLVCSTPLGVRPGNLWAQVECAFLNTLQARWQYAGERLGLGFAQGKSMLWQRQFLDARGGIHALAAEIAEDAAATKLVRAAGRHVHLVHSPFEQPLGERSGKQVWDRQLRWARLRRVTFPLFFAPELLSGGAVPLALGIAAALAGGVNMPLAALGVLAAWYGPEMALAARKGWPLSWKLVLAFLIRDAIIPAMWAAAWRTGRTVWRGNAMRIRFSRLDAPAPEPEAATPG
ncbi:glycosyltransferase [Roseomonas sp. SSH11]|uniref:Glycosyltransferase n=1 Tax=Pararoseomonas baculiformis TaxID=2820812 RepID=A0ABS4ACX9_9PROT|nr:ceramide glucosyltransferase [Pararoseomonas baculiformis]MBP0444368.1 glycosyltransferase [Pararoseomonas baculiformis]